MNTDVYESEESGPDPRGQAARQAAGPVGREGEAARHGLHSGIFLDAASGEGWDVAGLEPNTHLAAKAAERVPAAAVSNTTLEEAELQPGSFDAVTLWDVLEHVTDPIAFLSACRRLVKPSGTVLWSSPIS